MELTMGLTMGLLGGLLLGLLWGLLWGPFWRTHKGYARSFFFLALSITQVNVSKHHCYATMNDYLTKETLKKPVAELDSQIWKSEGHPAPQDIPQPLAHLQHAWRQRGFHAQEGRDKVMRARC